MNKVILMGRLTRDPEVRYSKGGNPIAIARYTLAVERRRAQEGQQSADFIPCVAMGKLGEFAEKYYQKGTKLIVEGRIQTGSYTNKDGVKVYTTEVMIDSQEFAESKGAGGSSTGGNNAPRTNEEGFMDIPEGIDEELPFT